MKASNKVESTIFKYMNNALYGSHVEKNLIY